MPAENGNRKTPLHRRTRLPSAMEIALRHLAAHAVGDRYHRGDAQNMAFLIWMYARGSERYEQIVARALLENLNNSPETAYHRDPEQRAQERNRREAFVEAVHRELAKLEADTQTQATTEVAS